MDLVQQHIHNQSWAVHTFSESSLMELNSFQFFGSMERLGRCFTPSHIRAVDYKKKLMYIENSQKDLSAKSVPSNATFVAMVFLEHINELYGSGGGVSGEPQQRFVISGFDSNGFANRYGKDTPIVFAYGKTPESRLVIPRASDIALPILIRTKNRPPGSVSPCAIDILRLDRRFNSFREKPVSKKAIVFFSDAKTVKDRDNFIAESVVYANGDTNDQSTKSTKIVKPPKKNDEPVPL